MREYALMMNMINYAGIYLKKKKTNRVLIMNTVKHLRWSVLQKGGVGELGGWGGGLVVKLGPFDFQKDQGRPSVSSLVQHMKVWLNFHQYPWIFQNILGNVQINSSDYARTLNMHDHFTCLTGFWRCLRF